MESVPEEIVPEFTLLPVNQTCTEVWIEIQTKNISYPAKLVYAGIEAISDSVVVYSDTTLYFENLLPQTNYQLVSTLSEIQSEEVLEDTLSFSTRDTTSHSFNWEISKFGGRNGSRLNDVFIFDENDIWAVGLIYDYNEPYLYNAVHWNGMTWEPKRIEVKLNNEMNLFEIWGIHAFNKNDIWLSAGYPIKGNGVSWELIDIWGMMEDTVAVRKMWGRNNNDLYGIGFAGKIVYYDGQNWLSKESGTEYILNQIVGNETDIFVSGGNAAFHEGVVLKSTNHSAFSTFITGDFITEDELFGKLFGITSALWLDENDRLYTGSGLIYIYKNGRWDFLKTLSYNDLQTENINAHRGATISIGGASSTDMWLVGDRNTIRHFNGSTWVQIGEPYASNSDYMWFSVKQKGNVAVAVGLYGNQGTVILMQR
ncbi:MAG: hypothetical protein SCALA702_02370 [Melioribacteraceae bacterium]|nr:MAG: hypothetical protein SCALA702_02370 [Melioribacteraceae bacterium]